MSIYKAVLKVHLCLKSVSIQPYSADSSSSFLEENPRSCKKIGKVAKLFEFLFASFALLFSASRVVWLFFQWKKYTTNQLDQGILYMLVACICIIYILLLQLQTTRCNTIVYLVNQIPQCAVKFIEPSTPEQVTPLGNHRLSSGQVFVYGLTLGIFIIPPALLLAPFAIDFSPLQIIVGSNHLTVKLVEGIFYFIYAIVPVVPFISIFLLMVAYMDGLQCAMLPLIDFNNSFCYRFDKLHKRFKMTDLLFQYGQELMGTFSTTVVCIGIVIASCCAFIGIKCFHVFHFVTYIGVLFILLLCFTIALLLTYLGNVPRKQSASFVDYWKGVMLNKERRKLLKNCKPLGFVLGPYGITTSKLGICICDDIIRNTVALILLT